MLLINDLWNVISRVHLLNTMVVTKPEGLQTAQRGKKLPLQIKSYSSTTSKGNIYIYIHIYMNNKTVASQSKNGWEKVNPALSKLLWPKHAIPIFFFLLCCVNPSMSSDIEQASLLLSRLYEQICVDLFEKRKKSTCYFQARKGNERTSLWLFWNLL